MATPSLKKLLSVNFEVFGKVQGVFFRKHTQKEATKLGLSGWVMNTPEETVVGQIQGQEDSIKKMKLWLKNTGSPKSRIDKVEFNLEKSITDVDSKSFDVRR